MMEMMKKLMKKKKLLVDIAKNVEKEKKDY
jgi:hypothetical protein